MENLSVFTKNVDTVKPRNLNFNFYNTCLFFVYDKCALYFHMFRLSGDMEFAICNDGMDFGAFDGIDYLMLIVPL